MTTPDSPRSAAWRRRILWLSFIESVATIAIERAIYFFSHERLAYTEVQNLALALVFGATYTAGARVSHAAARRFGDRRALASSMLVLLALHVLMAALPHGAVLAVSFAAVGFFEGTKWPIIESYVGAGLEPGEQLRAIGRFNVSWALAVPLAVAAAGPLIASGWPASLFMLAVPANVAGLLLVMRVPSAAPHLDAFHPSRLVEGKRERYRALLASSRWTMLSSYALMFLLAPLLPEVFQRLGRPVAEATFWAAAMDAVRVLTFAALALLPGWHGRAWPLWAGALGLPLGFFATMGGPSLAVVVLGEVMFGVLAGLTYYAALYYAMVVKNAAVDAGGGHESLIGLGLAIGPALGLLGRALSRGDNNPLVGMALAVALLLIPCWFGALRALLRVQTAERIEAGLS